jgi:hypothetical protein
MLTPKPALSSRSFQGGAIALIASVALSLLPFVEGLVSRRLPDHLPDIKDSVGILQILLGLAAAGGSTYGLQGVLRRSDIYTPEGLPGKNCTDCTATLEREAVSVTTAKPDLAAEVTKQVFGASLSALRSFGER